MMSRRIQGSISLVLIFVISIISITVFYINSVNEQNIAIIDYGNSKYQAELIADSYILMNYAKLKDEGITTENLFPGLEYTINHNIKEIIIDKIPYLELSSSISLENIEVQKTGRCSKYNEILFSEYTILEEKFFQGKKKEAFNTLKTNMEIKGKTSSNAPESIILTKTLRAGSVYIHPELFEFVNGEYSRIKYLNSFLIYEVNEQTVIGDIDRYTGNVTLNGICFLNSEIELNTNLTFNGIIVSNSGSINTNGYSCRINGLLIELGDGNFSGVDIKYNKGNIISSLKYIPWAEDIKLLYTVQNN